MTWTDEMYTILDLDTNLTPSRDLFISRCHPDDVAKIREAWKASKAYGTSFDIDFRIIRPSGEVRYAEVLTEIGCDVHGAPITMVGTLNDKTEQVVQDQEWHALELRFESGFEQSAIGTAIVDLKGLPLRVNQAVCDLLGRPKQELIGKQWTQFTHPDEIPLMTILNTRVEMGDASYADERRYVRPDGSTVWAAAHVSIVRDSEGVALYYFMNLLDITEYKRQSHELAHMAMHDSLTGLPNRALLADRLGQSLARCQRKDSKVNVMFIDIDNFKEVNDSLGHSSGDELLKHVAQQIGQSIRPGDTVARFGGDEFVVVCDNINDVETVTIGIRILEAIKEPVTIVDSEVHVTASIGISTSVASSTPETLLQTADFAMYRAKSLGPDNISLYDEILRNKVRQRLVTTAELHGALDRDEFKVFYQPVIDIWTGELVSAEALLRWEHASGILVNPSDFIPLAESAGLIIPIGAWVLEQACTQLVEWQKDLPALTLAVNLSVRQILDPKIISMIQSTLSRTKVPTMSISLELTESILMEDVDYCARTLSSLKELGVQLVIDDFGTGYSSLSYLKLFPFDAVKIDRAFVDGLGTDAHDSALVAAIIAMSTALELEVTAEGVETKEQLTLLKELNCHRAQGYYLSRPVCAEKFTELVRSGRRWAVT
jgi:diguanylate cyclase (GGDEF)-like protein/PAS domain S-box-containing protein